MTNEEKCKAVMDVIEKRDPGNISPTLTYECWMDDGEYHPWWGESIEKVIPEFKPDTTIIVGIVGMDQRVCFEKVYIDHSDIE